jgi:hypothetical protein
MGEDTVTATWSVTKTMTALAALVPWRVGRVCAGRQMLAGVRSVAASHAGAFMIARYVISRHPQR